MICALLRSAGASATRGWTPYSVTIEDDFAVRHRPLKSESYRESKTETSAVSQPPLRTSHEPETVSFRCRQVRPIFGRR
jgi:hypothetical protein